ncbi:PREDICTED: transmembrane protein 9B-like [Amphimedon queenslandica]|uniref:Uncharacterized protein n=1 Tax=Amphimedon queenslandica TaxID=400682 RepID=A0A1X7UEE4_AMPQE|nr:PREDICTED: transmembrane protein 9B-like [Amphimedon queenslandica]|eukprot:XP_003388202.1 PREDICTED: transmembrane protein 9B-like [Amphimedon queenslandica]
MAVSWLSKQDKKELFQWICNVFFLSIILLGLFFVVLLHLQVIPNVQDSRCKCVCPHKDENSTVFLKLGGNAEQCVCQMILPSADDSLCAFCTCTFETRNNLVVKFIIVTMTMLVCLLILVTFFYIFKKLWHNFRGRSIDYERIPSQDGINLNIQVARGHQRNRVR